MPYSPINSALLETAIASQALTQLNRQSVYTKVGIVGFENGAFLRGESVKIRRPKKRVAVDLNPRVSAATFPEGDFFSADVVLERLWSDGFSVFGHDPSQSIERYITETAAQTADAIATPNEDYIYNCFRTWSLPASGNVALGAHPPIAIVASTDGSGNIAAMNNTALRNAETVLDRANVPNQDRYAVLSAGAKGDFIGDGIIVSNGNGAIPGNLNINQEQFVRQGLAMATFVPRYNFMVAGSNAVQGQTGVADLDTAAGVQATLPIASVAANTAFTFADFASTSYVGAVDITLTVGTALQGVAVGQIARIGTAGSVKAFGVILRVTGSVITLVPYAPNGSVVPAAAIVPGTDVFSIPTIGSVNTVNHREALLTATRRIQEPSRGSGAVGATVVDEQSGLLIQVFSGNYDLSRVRELNAAYLLTGTRVSDVRKSALILSL